MIEFKVLVIGGDEHVHALRRLSLACEQAADACRKVTKAMNKLKSPYKSRYKNWEKQYRFHS